MNLKINIETERKEVGHPPDINKFPTKKPNCAEIENSKWTSKPHVLVQISLRNQLYSPT